MNLDKLTYKIMNNGLYAIGTISLTCEKKGSVKMNYVRKNVKKLKNSLTSLYTIGDKNRKAFVCNIQNYLDFSKLQYVQFH
jgi:hypothetical protein